MKTTTIIKALAYPVHLIDKRTGEHSTDTVVLEKSWLSICGKLDICDDKHLIYRIYNPKGFEVVEIGKRHKINLIVNLEQLYADHVGDMGKSQTFGILGVIADD